MSIKDMKHGNLYYLPPNDTTEPLYVDMVGIDYCHDNYRIMRNPSSITVIGYVISGRGCVDLNSKTFLAKSGDTFILPAKQYQEYYPDPSSKEDWVFLWFNIRGDLVLQLLDAYQLSGKGLFKNCYTEQLLRKGISFAENKTERSGLLLKSMSSVIMEIILEVSYQTKKTDLQFSIEVQKMKHFLDQRLEDHVSLEQLSAISSMTKRHINRLFRRELGTTPYNYLLDKKMELAQNLLVNTNLPVSVISRKLKFSDAYYFSNLFKKKTGLSPLHYRKNPY